MAVYGPFLKTDKRYDWRGTLVWYKYQQWYKAKPVTSAPNNYLMRLNTSNGNTLAGSWSYNPDHLWDSTFTGQVYKNAYDRFKDAIAEPASLAVSIAERKQAFDMMAKRTLQLYRFGRALLKFRLDDAARILGLAQRPRSLANANRKFLKDSGGMWLEYHLGWKPLIGDIHSALDVLQRGFPPFRVTGRARGYKSKVAANTSTRYWFQEQNLRVQLKATVNVSDPNLWQANQLGLINPAVVLWELVPFSFIVDWFLPVGDFLSQYTDFVGLTLSDRQTTYYSLHYDLDHWKDGRPYAFQQKWQVTVRRELGIASPPLVHNRVTGLSPTRAATAISLLLQQLQYIAANSRK